MPNIKRELSKEFVSYDYLNFALFLLTILLCESFIQAVLCCCPESEMPARYENYSEIRSLLSSGCVASILTVFFFLLYWFGLVVMRRHNALPSNRI